jgi:tRNA-specific 2-thiouridylase
MSGGVDSSLTAALLVEQGYDVTGVYMKNWSKDLPGMACPWKDDYQDAKRVAVQLGIPFKMYDFEDEYRARVVEYMIDGYRKGLTPNPDIMCNQEVKFKLFLEAAIADGVDMIATGHYAKIVPDDKEVAGASLHMAANLEKDQTYFLYRVTENALSRSLMPIGDIPTKTEVRAEAERRGLATAAKKDSQGICFVGKVGIKDFLLHELGEQPHGAIIDQNGVTIGEHDGAIFYTIGQRQGLGIGGGLPYYVTGKDMERNEVHVTTNLDDEKLWRKELRLTVPHWINEPPELGRTYQIRTRYRAPLVDATLLQDGPIDFEKSVIISLSQEVRAVTPGQSAVLYDSDRVVGGGIII